MKFYQACYGKPANKWEVLNISADMPPYMVSQFERIGSGCTPQNLGKGAAEDANGNPNCIYEWISTENILCVLRAQYGERDEHGRAKMFAHAFLTDAEGMLADPSTLLTIADSNFRFNADDTRTPPETLVHEGSYTLSAALKALGIDSQKWDDLIACVHVMLASPTDFPLYIVCRNDIDTVKNAMYAILCSLPYSLRYQLSFASANSLPGAKFKRIMFVDKLLGGERFFSLESGETNVDLGEIRHYPERFAPYKALCDSKPAAFAKYCDSLAATAAQMGYAYNMGYEDTAMVDTVMRGVAPLEAQTDAELTRHLNELLARLPLQNGFVDDYLAKVITVYDGRRLLPNDAILKRIELRNDSTQSPDYVDIYKRLRMRVLMNTGEAAMIAFLGEQHLKSRSQFDDWCDAIAKIDGGKDIIVKFYQKKVALCRDYRALFELLSTTGAYYKHPDLKSAARAQCIYIAKELTSVKNLCTANYQQTFDDLLVILGENFPEIGDTDKRRILETLRQHFWSTFRFADLAFEPRCMENCRAMTLQGNATSNNVNELILLYQTVRDYTTGTLSHVNIEQRLQKLEDGLHLAAGDRDVICPLVREYVYDALRREDDRHFCTWAILARFGDPEASPLPQMIRWNLPLLRDEHAFEQALKESPRMQQLAPTILVWLVGKDGKSGVLATIDTGLELHKTIKREAKLLQDFIKQRQAAERSREKEERKEERKKQREETVVADTVALDGAARTDQKEPAKKRGLFGLFDKKKKE